MYKLWVSIKKEFFLLRNDKAGLVMMFLMPILMVFIISIIQDSAFKVVNENKVSVLILDHDQANNSNVLVEEFKSSNFFNVEVLPNNVTTEEMGKLMLRKKILTGVYIPKGYSEFLDSKVTCLNQTLFEKAGIENKQKGVCEFDKSVIEFYHDPVLQENYAMSIITLIKTFVRKRESRLIIDDIAATMELQDADALFNILKDNQVEVTSEVVGYGGQNVTPNTSQHNVPAWTIFAMYFMVISLGSNIVKERLNGSFLRLKTMPTTFSLVLLAKYLVYLIAVFLQVITIFFLAKTTFPLIGLPALDLPDNLLSTFVVILLSATSAICFASLIGIAMKTQEQANGFGAISVVILAALGGIWVPSFVMPDYMKVIMRVSPLYWCLEAFYILFLKGGSWKELAPILLGLFTFSSACGAGIFYYLRKYKLV